MAGEQLKPTQVVAVGLDVGGRRMRQCRLLGRQQVDLKRRDDLVGDVVLDGEDVVERAIVALRPDLGAGGAVDQPGGDPGPVAGAADTALQHMTDLLAGTGVHGVKRGPPRGECRPATGHDKPGDL